MCQILHYRSGTLSGQPQLEDFEIVSIWGDEFLILENRFCLWALDTVESELMKVCDRVWEL
jgi:hypothetical protein